MVDIGKININTLPARADEQAAARRARTARKPEGEPRAQIGERIRNARAPDITRYAPGTGKKIEALEDLLRRIFEDHSFERVA